MHPVSVIVTALAATVSFTDGKLVTSTKTPKTTIWRSDLFPTTLTTTKYIALVHGGSDTTITGGIIITKTINVNLSYVSNTSISGPVGYITSLESSVDTALVAYKSSTMDAQHSST